MQRFPIALVLCTTLLAGTAGAQTRTKAEPPAKAWKAPRTAHGHPDLQGVWTNATLSPFERSANLDGKEFFTPAEAIEFEKYASQLDNRDKRSANADTDVGGGYNEAWFDRGHVVKTLRTSLVIDPEDGHIPPLTPAGKARAAEFAENRRLHALDGPEGRSLQERCILWPVAGPPMEPRGYNSMYQIVQSPNQVALLVEMIHDVRIIPTDNSPHLPPGVKQWMGDSRGHWEGDTLVVDTTNFTDQTRYRGTGEKLHLTERFTLTDPETMVYEFTIDDPGNYTRPWTVQLQFLRSNGPILEYACHEGNYAMTGILTGARRAEGKSAEK